jgi:hypothetical protein
MSINMGCCSSMICCRPGWSTGSPSIDVGCCSSPICCRPGRSTGSLSIDVGYSSWLIRCGSGRRRYCDGLNLVDEVSLLVGDQQQARIDHGHHMDKRSKRVMCLLCSGGYGDENREGREGPKPGLIIVCFVVHKTTSELECVNLTTQ